MKKSFSKILLGLLFICAAVVLVMDQLNLLNFQVGFWALVETVLFAYGVLHGILHRSIFTSLYSLAFLLMIYAKPLHLQSLVPWTILIVATLLGIGLKLIFQKSLKPTVVFNSSISDREQTSFEAADSGKTKNIFSNNSAHLDNNRISLTNFCSETSRYVHSQNLETIYIKSVMSDTNLYLDDAKAAGSNVDLTLDASITEINLYIPFNWQINNQLHTNMCELSISGHATSADVTLTLNGKATMSEITINYV